MTRRGTTLVEMLVAIAILALVAAVVAGGVRAAGAPSEEDRARTAIAAARSAAIDSGRATTILLRLDSASYAATAFPDGRVLTAAPLGVAPLTGRPDARR